MDTLNQSRAVFLIRTEVNDDVLEHAASTLMIGRREEHVVLTVEVPNRLPIELVIGDVDSLVRQLDGAATSSPIAVLLRAKGDDAVPLTAGGVLTVSRLDEYFVLRLQCLAMADSPVELVLEDVESVIRQLRSVAPASARPFGIVLREAARVDRRLPRKA